MTLIFLIATFVACLYKIKVLAWNDNYLSKSQTTSINGLFILIVYLSHANGYLDFSLYNDIGTSIYNLFFRVIGQMMVVMFFFYSGFGLMQQYITKGNCYIKGFARKRILKTWIHFIFVLLIYVLINIIFGFQYSLFQWISCWIGWESIGNSNWYMFDILVLYIFFYISMLLTKKRKNSNRHIFILISAMTIMLWIVLYIFKSEQRWWYDTILAFPFGILYSITHKKIDSICKRFKFYIPVLLGVLFTFLVLYYFRNPFSISIAAVLFASIILLTTMHIKIENKFLDWLGKHLFSIYILQRIPMIILKNYGINYTIVFIGLSFIVTVILTIGLDYIFKLIDKTLFN